MSAPRLHHQSRPDTLRFEDPEGLGLEIAVVQTDDAPLTADQFTACKGCVQIPWALSATSIPYRLDGGPNRADVEHSRFSSAQLVVDEAAAAAAEDHVGQARQRAGRLPGWHSASVRHARCASPSISIAALPARNSALAAS